VGADVRELEAAEHEQADDLCGREHTECGQHGPDGRERHGDERHPNDELERRPVRVDAGPWATAARRPAAASTNALSPPPVAMRPEYATQIPSGAAKTMSARTTTRPAESIPSPAVPGTSVRSASGPPIEAIAKPTYSSAETGRALSLPRMSLDYARTAQPVFVQATADAGAACRAVSARSTRTECPRRQRYVPCARSRSSRPPNVEPAQPPPSSSATHDSQTAVNDVAREAIVTTCHPTI
jgi:hypothetical protein